MFADIPLLFADIHSMGFTGGQKSSKERSMSNDAGQQARKEGRLLTMSTGSVPEAGEENAGQKGDTPRKGGRLLTMSTGSVPEAVEENSTASTLTSTHLVICLLVLLLLLVGIFLIIVLLYRIQKGQKHDRRIVLPTQVERCEGEELFHMK